MLAEDKAVVDSSPEEQLPEVLALAAELHEAERERDERAQDYVEAAEEVGIPREYMDRAASMLRGQATQRALRKRAITRALIVAAVAGVSGGLAIMILSPATAGPRLYDFEQAPERRWALQHNPGSEATATFPQEQGHGHVAAISVARFKPEPDDGRFFVNLTTGNVPSSLSEYRTVSFDVRGSGLANIRVYLRASSTERWRSPPLAVTPRWQRHSVAIEQFDYQRRVRKGAPWNRESFETPGSIADVSFKLGYWVNEADAHGEVFVDELLFE